MGDRFSITYLDFIDYIPAEHKALVLYLEKKSISLSIWALWFLPIDLIAVGSGIFAGFIEYYIYKDKY